MRRDIYYNGQQGIHCEGVYRLKQSFDTIDHGLLMKKQERYGIRGTAYSWLRRYLDDRYRYVQMNNVKSDL